METGREVLILFAGLLILAIFSAGCSDGGQAGAAETTVPATAVTAKFTAGDIIAKSATSTDTFLLIVKYDAATDRYERALAYKKTGGSWYRKDDSTQVSGRSVIEKLYPVKVAHAVSLGEVPVVTPTTAPTALTSTVMTTTTTSYPAPTVSSITPNAGLAGTTVTITSISGTYFRPGVTVRLSNATTSTTISGTSVVAKSASNITCLFSIPSGGIAGTWNLTLTNPDGKYGTLGNAFTITNTTATTQTTTTTAVPAPSVSGITPNSGIAGMQAAITNLAGSNLLNATAIKLTKSGSSDISATNVSVVSSTQITCTFALPSAASGTWNVLVTNSASQSGIGTGLFTVNPYAEFKNATATPTSGIAPLTVSFDDMSTGSPIAWTWNFGDGNSTAIQSPTHPYAFAGTFTVTLTVSNAGGSDTRTKTDYITVL
jgi:hypothetical protein